MDLKNTIYMMQDPYFKERFKAEYYQLENRYNGLVKMIQLWKDGKLDFEPKCSLVFLQAQADVMKHYMEILEARAEIEGIEL